MTAEIVDFTTARFRPRAIAALRDTAEAPPPPTTTAKNARLRSTRREVWRRADAITEYWLRLLRFADAAEIAKRYGLKEAGAHIDISNEARLSILSNYHEALDKQLLTPAPDIASVNWKRRERKSYGVEKELVEKAIADDLAFLDAHPTRKPRANKLG